MHIFPIVASLVPFALASIPFRHAALHSSAIQRRQTNTYPQSFTPSTTTTPIPPPASTPTSQTASTPTPRLIGLNIVNQSPTGGWKTPADWDKAFTNVVNNPNNNAFNQTGPKFNAVRLYSTSEGPNPDNTTAHLSNALPMARKHNLQIHAGVWSGGDTHTARFATELAALDAALASFGCANIAAVSVGSEDLYRNESTAVTGMAREPLVDVMLLVDQVQRVMEVLDRHGCCDVRVTHADTFGEWLRVDVTEPLVRQVDFVTVNVFPYWEGVAVEDAGAVFWQHLGDVRAMAARYGKEVWVGESGWPVSGDDRGAASPGTSQLQRYWSDVGCALFDHQDLNAFWYAEWDEGSAPPSFGLLDTEGHPVIDLVCP